MDTPHEAHSMSRTGPDGGGAKPRACANCARLKIKCRWPEYGNGNPDAACLRCARMKFSCHVPAATQKRKRGKSTRVAQLEEKLDGIVSLLAAHRHLQASSMSPTPPEPSKEPRESPREAVRPSNANSREPLGRDVEDLSAMYRLFPGFSLTGEQATAYLEIYQTELMPNFPFVVIPPSMDAHALYSQSPSLFWVTMAAVAPQSLAIQEEVRKWLRQYIAEHMIVKQEKSLQLLQTLLLHMAWSDYHYYVYSDATNFLQLAMSLVIDLRLDKSPDTTGVMPKSLLGETWTALNKGAPYRLGVPHTLAEKRAVLGFYHFSSIVSLLFRRGAQLPWNHYLSQCCDSLLDAREYEGDMYAVALVRMQCISDRVSGFLPPTGTGDRDNSVYRPPLEMAIKSLRAELDRFAHSQPAFVSHNNVFWAYYHGLVMRLYEPIISMRVSPASSSDTFSSETFQRTESLWKCLESAADFFGSLQAIPSTQLPLLPLTANVLLALVVVTTSRLLLLEGSNDWDSAPARRKLDFAAALDRIADLFEQADRWAQGAGRRRRPQEDTENAPCMYTFRLRWVRQWYLSKISHSEMPHQQQQPRTSGARPAQALTANQWGDVSLEDMDMDFWPELFYGPIPEVTLPTPPVMGWSM